MSELIRKTLEFRWTVSKGRDTYGYNICSLWIQGKKVASCNGGGYDMQGTVLGNWLGDNFTDRLKKLPCNYGSGDNTEGYYGLTFHGPRPDYKSHNHFQKGDIISLNGACGFSSMERIAKAIGVNLQFVLSSNNLTVYTAEWKE